jgi:threonine synthase
MSSGEIRCTNCGRGYPEKGLPHACPICGGIFDYSSPWRFNLNEVDDSQPGIWRYRATFGLPEGLEPISLGEGNTPLKWVKAFKRKVAFKCEHLNPTGSFKDRGSTVITGWLRARGVKEFIEDSSGNAGASIAAYAQRAGMRARIFIPASTSEIKVRKMQAMGAEIVSIPGSRAATSEAVLGEAGKGTAYASHAYLPFNLPGYATCAYEIYHQLGDRMPGTVIVPAGQGGLLLGIKMGFDALRIAMSIEGVSSQSQNARKPFMVAVQATACAPLWAVMRAGTEGMRFVTERPTLAEGVKIRQPVRGDAVIQAIVREPPSSIPSVCIVEEEKIIEGQKRLKRAGFDIEPTSAIVWNALEQIVSEAVDPVVVILTGAARKQ